MRQSESESDDRIVRRVVGGDLDAFERLIDRHSKHVFRVVARHVPADREDRLVLTLEYLEDLTIRECSDALGWTESKVKVRAHRARLRLKELLTDHASRTEGRS